MPQSGSKHPPPQKTNLPSKVACWHGPSHKPGCLWRSKAVEDSSGSWKSILPRKTSWHLFSKHWLCGFMLKGSEELFSGISPMQECQRNPTSFSSFMWFYFVSCLTWHFHFVAPSPQHGSAGCPIHWQLGLAPWLATQEVQMENNCFFSVWHNVTNMP